jgi:uncharacterized protein
MYHFSRSIYRELAPRVIEDPADPTGCQNKQRVLDSCEATIRRLAYDRRYFARPARSLFSEIRVHFAINDQLRVRRVVECNIALALEFLDRVQGHTQLRLLLCGSAVRYMEAAIEYRAPLYGRFDLTLPVYPFRPREAAAMLPNLTPADRAAVYGLVGGMPLYLSWWDQGASVAENLMELACQPGARLLTEGRLVLATEAGDGDQPSAVLRAIATGKTKFNEIADVTGTNPTRTLDRLKELRLVERLLPVTESPKSRRRIYRICDNFLAFYLGPLMRYRGEIELGIGQSILPSLVASLDDHFGLAYEEAFREHLRDLAVTGELGPGVVAVGSWWRDDGDSQIDGVVLAERGRTRTPILVGECKWTRSVNATRLRNRLYEKAAQLTDKRDELSYAVCAREEVTHVQDETLTITADDIFAP